jgi:chromosome segregation ATPase
MIDLLKEQNKAKMMTAIEKMRELKGHINTEKEKVTYLEESLEAANRDVAKYKGAMDKALPKFRDLKAELDMKSQEAISAVTECGLLKIKVAELELSKQQETSEISSNDENPVDKIESNYNPDDQNDLKAAGSIEERKMLQTRLTVAEEGYRFIETELVSANEKCNTLEKQLTQSTITNQESNTLLAAVNDDLTAAILRENTQNKQYLQQILLMKEESVKTVDELDTRTCQVESLGEDLEELRNQTTGLLNKVSKLEEGARASKIEYEINLEAARSNLTVKNGEGNDDLKTINPNPDPNPNPKEEEWATERSNLEEEVKMFKNLLEEKRVESGMEGKKFEVKDMELELRDSQSALTASAAQILVLEEAAEATKV